MSTEAKNPLACRVVFAGTSLVLVANELNLSIFKPVWLGQFGILKPDEITEASVISPAAIQIAAPKFNLVILPNRLQMMFLTLEEEKVVEPLNRVMGGILKNLPHTPWIAIGINFDFFVIPEDQSRVDEWNKKNFASKQALAICNDHEKHPRFGSYFSMSFDGMRMKVDAKPVHKASSVDPKVTEALKVAPEWMLFNFNYHLDLDSAAPVKHAQDSLTKWTRAASHCSSIIAQISSSI